MASVDTTVSGLTGRTALVTGASHGIGKETAVALAGMGARVVLVCRDPARGEAARVEVTERSGSTAVDLAIADLSRQGDIRSLATDFLASHDRLHVLVNNAGTFEAERSVTVDGIETTFAVNHLGPFLLTNLLLPLLKASAPSRVVTVSSTAQGYAKIYFDDLQGERRYGAMRAYSQSKLGNVLFTRELARRLEGTSVTANCLHPGGVATGLVRYTGVFGAIVRAALTLGRPLTLNAEQGAATSVYLASSPEVEGVTGEYFVKRRPVRSSKESYDADVARRLWEISEALTGGH